MSRCFLVSYYMLDKLILLDLVAFSNISCLSLREATICMCISPSY